MLDGLMLTFLICIFVIPIGVYTTQWVSCVKCYRVLAKSYLNMKGETITNYKVQQKHSLFRGRITWWTIENSGGEYSSGSVFGKLEEADHYIKALLFDTKESVKISNTICENSTDRDVTFEA